MKLNDTSAVVKNRSTLIIAFAVLLTTLSISVYAFESKVSTDAGLSSGTLSSTVVAQSLDIIVISEGMNNSNRLDTNSTGNMTQVG